MKKQRKLLFTGTLCILFIGTSFVSQNRVKENDYEVIVSGLRIPWGFTFLPDNSMLITEKHGRIVHFKNGKKTVVNGLPRMKTQGQGGLMDIELHPNFEKNNYIYFTYVSSAGGGGGNTALMRAVFKDGMLSQKKLLYKGTPNTRAGQHFGSRIAFDKEGYLYFSIGDRGNRDVNPQDLSRDGGKIYRLHDDGRIPKDNPFVAISGAKKAVYSYGHRNPQGMELNPFTGEIWTHEHGPRGGDEINIIKAGKNYGWPKASFGINYSGSKFTNKTSIKGMEDPLHHWTPSIAPSGMAFVNSNKYPKMKGDLLVGSLKFGYVTRCILKNGKVIKEERLLNGIGRVRAIEQGNDGYIYVGVEHVGIVRLKSGK
ncbi:PQQ-dependent sugar dehydrogenase [Flavobacteriaceae bacterium S356]|uniref:PQQ-dependent sugar dehydrogenase n=1 Tax=Asprobacillus argus TaxID=3076534 RepID=A0ABU3LI83_9FLAO|nr:PQQ-dependent sugar dehydrogenase [Flavobacteriaceae bacterium S356]